MYLSDAISIFLSPFPFYLLVFGLLFLYNKWPFIKDRLFEQVWIFKRNDSNKIDCRQCFTCSYFSPFEQIRTIMVEWLIQFISRRVIVTIVRIFRGPGSRLIDRLLFLANADDSIVFPCPPPSSPPADNFAAVCVIRLFRGLLLLLLLVLAVSRARNSSVLSPSRSIWEPGWTAFRNDVHQRWLVSSAAVGRT